jgi:hypothetical protein
MNKDRKKDIKRGKWRRTGQMEMNNYITERRRDRERRKVKKEITERRSEKNK